MCCSKLEHDLRSVYPILGSSLVLIGMVKENQWRNLQVCTQTLSKMATFQSLTKGRI